MNGFYARIRAGTSQVLEMSISAAPAGPNSHYFKSTSAVKIRPNLEVTTYLTVAQNCKLGVCAPELGHLLFQWQDFYDPNSDEDGQLWRGSGDWDLMASGSYNFGSAVPAHPAGLHKMQHNWVATLNVTKSTAGVRLAPTTATGGRLCKITSPAFAKDQFLLLESRPRTGFDKYLPGEGLLVWRVDLAKEMYAPATPGMQLVQADGEQQLEFPDSTAQGDDSDPFPGSKNVTQIDDSPTEPSTSLPGKRSGITLTTRLGDVVADRYKAIRSTEGATSRLPALRYRRRRSTERL